MKGSRTRPNLMEASQKIHAFLALTSTVRRSHWLESTAYGRVLTLLRIAPASAIAFQSTELDGASLALQFLRLGIAWACLLIARPTDTITIHFRQRFLPIGRGAITAGAALGWRVWELVPVCLAAVAGVYFHLGRGFPSPAVLLSGLALGIGSGIASLVIIGVVRAASDAFLRGLPAVSAAFVAPILFAVSLTFTPLHASASSLMVPPVVTLLGINLGFYDASLRATAMVPGLVTQMYRDRALTASTIAAAGVFLAGCVSGLPLGVSGPLGAAVMACSLLWWRAVWARSVGATFALTVLIQSGLMGAIVGVLEHPLPPMGQLALFGAIALIGASGTAGLWELGQRKTPGDKLSRRLATLAL